MSVVLLLRIQVFKELLKIFAVFYKTEMNLLKEVLREVLEAGSVEIFQPEKPLGQNTVSYSSFKWILFEKRESPVHLPWSESWLQWENFRCLMVCYSHD